MSIKSTRYDVSKVVLCVGVIHFLKTNSNFKAILKTYQTQMEKSPFNLKLFPDGSVEVDESIEEEIL